MHKANRKYWGAHDPRSSLNRDGGGLVHLPGLHPRWVLVTPSYRLLVLPGSPAVHGSTRLDNPLLVPFPSLLTPQQGFPGIIPQNIFLQSLSLGLQENPNLPPP